MSTKQVMHQPPPIEAQKPGRFYLKKWLIIIISVLKFIYCVFVIIGLTFLLIVKPAENTVNNDNVNTLSEDLRKFKVFVIFFLLLGIITAISELIGSIGAYKERLGLIKFYFVYCIIRCVINLVARIIFINRSQQRNKLKHSSEIDYVQVVFDTIFTALFAAIVFYYMLDLRTIEQAKRNFQATQEEAIALKTQVNF